MDMDLDIGWCLTCSKKTRDQSSPYCSDICRQHDLEPESMAKEAHSITSPLPPKFIPLPPTPGALSRNQSSRVSGTTESRPDSFNGVGAPSPRRSSRERPAAHMLPQRDRRAFSMSASEDGERVSLPFARKAKPVNRNPRSFKKHLYVSADAGLASMSTGANTPNFEPTFESTSNSDASNEDVPVKARRSPVASLAALHPPPPMPSHRQTSADAVPAASQATSLSSPLQTARPALARSRASSPITRMGSSSRSREDIISWARQVDYGGSQESDSRGKLNRNRPRTCRPRALSNIPPPSTESLDEPAGLTPKGSVGAFGALHMTFTPVVDVIRRVSNAASPPKVSASTSSPKATTSSSLGLAPLPAPAEVSIVDVVVATRGPDAEHVLVEMDTPTLSTVSFSEAFDNSATTDFGETIETATDDFSIVSSVDRRPAFSPAVHRAALPSLPKNVAATQSRRSSAPLRPIRSTASAFWTFSSYLRSLTPFAVPTSLVPAFTTSSGEPLSTPAAPELEPDMPVTPADAARNTAPLPAMSMQHGQDSDSSEDAAHDLVRSVPMDIVITGKAAAMCEERKREREALDLIKKGRGSMPRTPPLISSRSPSAGPDLDSGRPQSPDARERNSDGGSDRRSRGRGRDRGRGGRRSPPPEAEEEEEVRRGRRRDRANESRDRSWSAARGRTRSRHPPPHPVLVEGVAA